jgi:hypothetical protein
MFALCTRAVQPELAAGFPDCSRRFLQGTGLYLSLRRNRDTSEDYQVIPQLFMGIEAEERSM